MLLDVLLRNVLEFQLIIVSTLSSHCVVVSLRPSLTTRRFSRLPYCSRSFLFSRSTSSLLRRVVTSFCRSAHLPSEFCSLFVRRSLSLLNSDTSNRSFYHFLHDLLVKQKLIFVPFFSFFFPLCFSASP